MVQWVYILKCEEDNIYYIGETERLFRRFDEHLSGEGGINTSLYGVDDIISLYKVSTICNFLKYNKYCEDVYNGKKYKHYMSDNLKFFDERERDENINYDKLYAENNIVECLMIHRKSEWKNFKGGKYTKINYNYNFPLNNLIKDLPLCKCDLPCDIKKHDEGNYLYFRCAKKNMWGNLVKKYKLNDPPCNFFQKYTKGDILKREEEKRKILLEKLFKNSRWLSSVETVENNCYVPCIGCHKMKNKIRYKNKRRNICYDCFIDKNKEFSEKYNKNI